MQPQVAGYAISRQINTELALAALTTAMQARNPPPGTCHPPYRPWQPLRQCSLPSGTASIWLISSMSAIANPYDNAQAESFMKTLTVEEVYLEVMRSLPMSQRACHDSLKKSIMPSECTRRLAMYHPTSSKHNSRNRRFNSLSSHVQSQAFTPSVDQYYSGANTYTVTHESVMEWCRGIEHKKPARDAGQVERFPVQDSTIAI